MRALLLVALLTIPLATAAGIGVRSPCNDWAPGSVVDASCQGPIHPGARSSACTLNWVVTDGARVFIGAAKHCTSADAPELFVEGVDHAVGTLVLQDANDTGWYQIHDADVALVDGSLQQWGGPAASEPATQVKGIAAGTPVVWFGHGYATDAHAPLRGRAGPLLEWYSTGNSFLFAGEVSGGDSGSPVMLASGEALGMVSATVFPASLSCLVGACPPVDVPVSSVVFGVSLKTEMAYLSTHYAHAPIHLVTGRPMLAALTS